MPKRKGALKGRAARASTGRAKVAGRAAGRAKAGRASRGGAIRRAAGPAARGAGSGAGDGALDGVDGALDGVDEALVEKTVAMLREHDRRTVESKRRIGAHILEGYFGGDAELVRSRNAYKEKSFERLAQRAREDTLWRERDLREAVTIELCARSLLEQVAEGVEASYLLMLASVDDLEERQAIAARIANGALAGEAARIAIRAASGERRGGRRPQAAAAAGAAALARKGQELGEDGAYEPEALAALPVEELEEVQRDLAEANVWVDGFAREVEDALRERRREAARGRRQGAAGSGAKE